MIELFNVHCNEEKAKVLIDDVIDSGKFSYSSEYDANSYSSRLATDISRLMGFKYGVPCASGTIAALALMHYFFNYKNVVNVNVQGYNYIGLLNVIKSGPIPNVNISDFADGIDLVNMDTADFPAIDGPTLDFQSFLYGNTKKVGYRHPDVYTVGDLSHLTGVHCGDLGLDYAFCSLYPTKNVNAGEGGIILLNDPGAYIDILGLVKSAVFNPYSFNMRMSELNAAFGFANLVGLESRLGQRKYVYDYLYSEFGDLVVDGRPDYPYMFVVNLNHLPNTDENGATLAEDYIGAFNARGISVSTQFYGNGSLALPCHDKMSRSDAVSVVDAFADIFKEYL